MKRVLNYALLTIIPFACAAWVYFWGSAMMYGISNDRWPGAVFAALLCVLGIAANIGAINRLTR